MARGFTRDGDHVVFTLDEQERDIMVSLFEQTIALLESAAPAPSASTDQGDGSSDSHDAPARPTEDSITDSVSADGDEFRRMLREAGLEMGADAGAEAQPVPPGEATPEAPPGMPDPDNLFGGGIDEDALADPALGRLLPDAHHSDPLAAAEFRRYSADGVRRTKIERLLTAASALAGRGEAEQDGDGRGKPGWPRRRATDVRVRLTAPEAVALLVAFTDVRLVLASRMGIETEEDMDALEAAIVAGAAQHAAPLILTYDFLTWLQEVLAGVLDTFE